MTVAVFDWIVKALGLAAEPVPESVHVPELPDGVYKRADGALEAECRSCGKWYELPCDPEEYDPDYSYCGGSPRCCP